MLSPREIEVWLFVRGRTNAEIAAQLCLSERTIHRHVSNILTKLGVRNRAEAAAYAARGSAVQQLPEAGAALLDRGLRGR